MQARRMEKAAACVMTLGPESSVTVEYKPKRDLKVVTVLGPAEQDGRLYEQASLLEVGFERNRPYSATRHRSERHHWFKLTADQYRACAPSLFSFLQQLVDERVGKWRERQFWLPFPNVFLRRRGYSESHARKKPVDRGIRIKVDRSDEFLIADMFAIERECLSDELYHLGRFVDMVLAKRPYHRGNFRKSVAWKILSHSLARRSLLPHHKQMALTQVRRDRYQQRQVELEELIGELPEWPVPMPLPAYRTRTAALPRLRIVRVTVRGITVEIYPTEQTPAPF